MTQLNYQRKPSAQRFSLRRSQRWIRRTFTRDNLVQTVKTLAWVVPLTVLIWVYAEREQVKVINDVSLPIEIRIDNPLRVVTLKQPYPDRSVVASLSGSQGNLDRFLTEVTPNTPLQITIDTKAAVGVQQYNTGDELRNLSLFKKYGIAVDSCSPPNIAVDVDEFESHQVTVQAPPDMATIVGQPVFKPPTVLLRGPHQAMPASPVVYADLAGLAVLNKPGEHTISNVVLKTLPDEKRLSIEPGEVKASVTVRANDVQYTYDSLQLWANMPAAMSARYLSVFDGSQIVPNVTIVGPPDKIDLLRRADFQPVPRASVDANPSDIGRNITRKPKIDLPPDMGLHVLNEDAIQPVDFHLVDTKAQP